MCGLSLEEANTIIAATFAAAKKRKCRPMSAIVLDAGGRVKAFQKQDGASMLRLRFAMAKPMARWRSAGHPSLCWRKRGKSRYLCNPWSGLQITRPADPRQDRRAFGRSLATPMNSTIYARLPGFTPRNSAPTAIFLTIRT
jgi:hypothetical protein